MTENQNVVFAYFRFENSVDYEQQQRQQQGSNGQNNSKNTSADVTTIVQTMKGYFDKIYYQLNEQNHKPYIESMMQKTAMLRKKKPPKDVNISHFCEKDDANSTADQDDRLHHRLHNNAQEISRNCFPSLSSRRTKRQRQDDHSFVQIYQQQATTGSAPSATSNNCVLFGVNVTRLAFLATTYDDYEFSDRRVGGWRDFHDHKLSCRSFADVCYEFDEKWWDRGPIWIWPWKERIYANAMMLVYDMVVNETKISTNNNINIKCIVSNVDGIQRHHHDEDKKGRMLNDPQFWYGHWIFRLLIRDEEKRTNPCSSYSAAATAALSCSLIDHDPNEDDGDDTKFNISRNNRVNGVDASSSSSTETFEANMPLQGVPADEESSSSLTDRPQISLEPEVDPDFDSEEVPNHGTDDGRKVIETPPSSADGIDQLSECMRGNSESSATLSGESDETEDTDQKLSMKRFDSEEGSTAKSTAALPTLIVEAVAEEKLATAATPAEQQEKDQQNVKRTPIHTKHPYQKSEIVEKAPAASQNPYGISSNKETASMAAIENPYKRENNKIQTEAPRDEENIAERVTVTKIPMRNPYAKRNNDQTTLIILENPYRRNSKVSEVSKNEETTNDNGHLQRKMDEFISSSSHDMATSPETDRMNSATEIGSKEVDVAVRNIISRECTPAKEYDETDFSPDDEKGIDNDNNTSYNNTVGIDEINAKIKEHVPQIDSNGVDLTILSEIPFHFRSEARLAMAVDHKDGSPDHDGENKAMLDDHDVSPSLGTTVVLPQIDSDGFDLTTLSEIPFHFRSEARLAMMVQENSTKVKRKRSCPPATADPFLRQWLSSSSTSSSAEKSTHVGPGTLRQGKQEKRMKTKRGIHDFFIPES